MGWKTLKNHFNLHSAIIQVNEGKVFIGSGYAQDLIVIDMQTGEKKVQPFFTPMPSDLQALKESPPHLILQLLKTPDSFAQSLPVFTYEGSEILALECEEYGFSNLTHCGRIMHVNLYHRDKEKVVLWARENLLRDIRNARSTAIKLEEELLNINKTLDSTKEDLIRFDRRFSSVHATLKPNSALNVSN